MAVPSPNSITPARWPSPATVRSSPSVTGWLQRSRDRQPNRLPRQGAAVRPPSPPGHLATDGRLLTGSRRALCQHRRLVTQIAALDNATFAPPWGGTSAGQQRSKSVGPRTDHPGRGGRLVSTTPSARVCSPPWQAREPTQHHPGRVRMQRPRQLLGARLQPALGSSRWRGPRRPPTPVSGRASPPTKPSKPSSTRAIWYPRAQTVRSTRTRRSRAAGGRGGGEPPTHFRSADLIAGHLIAW
jgi:hypothetical protein